MKPISRLFSQRSARLAAGLSAAVFAPLLSAGPIFTGSTLGSGDSGDANFVDVGASGAGYYIWSNADQTQWSVRWTGVDSDAWDGAITMDSALVGDVQAQDLEAVNSQFGSFFGFNVDPGTIDGLAYDNGSNDVIELDVRVARASPAPPVGPALGVAGLNILLFAREFNERSLAFGAELDFVPVTVGANSNKSFNFVIDTAPSAPEFITWQGSSDGDNDIDGFDFTIESTGDLLEFGLSASIFDSLLASVGSETDSVGIFMGAGLSNVLASVSFDDAAGFVQQSFAIDTSRSVNAVSEPGAYALLLAGLGFLRLPRRRCPAP